MIGLMARLGEVGAAITMVHRAMVVDMAEAMGVMEEEMVGEMEEAEEVMVITRTTKMTIREETVGVGEEAVVEEDKAVDKVEVMEVAMNLNVGVKGEAEVRKTTMLHNPLNLTSHLQAALINQTILILNSQLALNAKLILYVSSQQSSKLSLLPALAFQIVKTQ